MKSVAKAAFASTALSALFLAVYPLCSWITSRRAGVRSFYFAWERHLPFVPALIIPYMSIDLFFVAAPFLTRFSGELRTLALRITTAILVAGGCFLLFPLRFAFDRPHVDGLLGIIFNNFRSMDLPFNQCPSLHIALWAILIHLYSRRTRGWIRAAMVIWFGLIFFSTVLTYQHHVIDVIGGIVLAIFCFYLFPDEPLQRSETVNRRVANYYAVGALVLICLAVVVVPWSYFLLWPVIALALVSLGYSRPGSNIFRKKAGAIPCTAWFIFWPVLIGQRLSLAYYARQCRAYDRLTDHLWIGRRLSNREARKLCNNGVVAVVDLASEIPESKPFLHLNYLQLTVLDLTAPGVSQIDQALEFIEQNIAEGDAYLHCKAGYSRTAVIAGAYLLASGRANDVEHAVAMLRQARPSIIIRPEAMGALNEYHARRQAASANDVQALLSTSSAGVPWPTA